MEKINCIDREALESKHRNERKELQSRIQVLKKSATKGDKKKKKEVTEEICKLEQELERKHLQELSELEEQNDNVSSITKSLENVGVAFNFKEVPLRASKAQKRREKKAQQERERTREIEEQEKLNVHGARNVETQKIKSTLKERNLMVHEIPSDGNCLYCAVDHQLTLTGSIALGLEKLRLLTSQFLLEHSSDYLPFMSHPETGDLLSEGQFKDYCDKVATTSAWGGEVELQALSHVLKKRIEVIQAVGPTITIGDSYPAEKQLTLAYHRHMYGLGEHYNSVKPYEEPLSEETA